MSRPNVLVIDAGLGNIGSVVAAFQRLDCVVQRVSHPPSVEVADVFHAVLPGVGAFDAGMRALKINGWEAWIKEVWCKWIACGESVWAYNCSLVKAQRVHQRTALCQVLV